MEALAEGSPLWEVEEVEEEWEDVDEEEDEEGEGEGGETSAEGEAAPSWQQPDGAVDFDALSNPNPNPNPNPDPDPNPNPNPNHHLQADPEGSGCPQLNDPILVFVSGFADIASEGTPMQVQHPVVPV